MNLTQELIEHYYRTRLDGNKIHHSKGFEWRSQCAIHGGDNPNSMLIDTSDGHFVCFACKTKGKNVIAFEQEMLKREMGVVPEFGIVQESVSKILGMPLLERIHHEEPKTIKGGWDRSKAQARYIYTDELGEEQFSVWRFRYADGRKATPPDFPCRCKGSDACENECEKGRCWGARGVRRVLYRLPDVIQSSLVFVVEGERNADDLSRAISSHIKNTGGFKLGALILDRVAVTTNSGGALAWKKEYGYGKFFHGKVVVKLGDNDGAGRQHDEDACSDIGESALQLFKLELPVGEGEDISDFLVKNDISDFIKLLSNRVPYKLLEKVIPTVKEDSLSERVLLVRPSDLTGPRENGGNWIVPGFIERGTRGLVVAPPKTGKSLLFLDLALCIGTGQSFLCMPRSVYPVKVAIISREDGPVMVKRRLSQLAAGHGLSAMDVDRNILVNTIEQSSRFRIDNQKDLEEMAKWLKMSGVEFTVIDVLNKIHAQEENSSTDMTRVMSKFDELAHMSGSQVCVIHHTNKIGGVKGSTSIEGWADYVFRLEADKEDESIKTLFVKTKSTGQISPRSMKYIQNEEQTISRISLIQNERSYK